MTSRRPRWLWVLVLLAAVIRAPVLSAGFVSDDFVLLAAMEGRSPLGNTPLDLWTFYDGVPSRNAELVYGGALPWWTAPTASHAFYRPLSSAVLSAMHEVFGRRAFAYYVLVLALCACNVMVVGTVFARLLPSRAAAISTLFFCVHPLHAGPSLWLSTIHVPLATVAGMSGFLAHQRWRSEGWRAGRFLAPVGFALGLAAGEAGLFPLVFAFSYEILLRTGEKRERLRALAIPSVLGVGYLALYQSFGFGARGIDGYLDPREGIRILSVLGERLVHELPRLVTAPCDLLLSETTSGIARAAALVAGLGFVLLAVGAFVREADLRRTMAFFCVSSLCAALPALLGPSERALYASTVGSSAVVGTVVVHGWEIWRGRHFTGAPVRILALAASSVLAIAHAGLAGYMAFDAARSMVASSRRQMSDVAALRLPNAESTDVIVILANDQPSGPWGGILYGAATGRAVKSWQALSLAPEPHRFTRTREDAFELEAGGQQGFAMHLYRNADLLPMTAGQRVVTRSLSIEVLEVKDGRPTRIRAEAGGSLDDETLCFVSRFRGSLKRLRLPPVGTAMVLF